MTITLNDIGNALIMTAVYLGFSLMLADVLVKDKPSLEFKSTFIFITTFIPVCAFLMVTMPIAVPYILFRDGQRRNLI